MGRQGQDELYIFGAGKAVLELEEAFDFYDTYKKVILVEDKPTTFRRYYKDVISYKDALSRKDVIEYGFISCNNVDFKERVDKDFPEVLWDNFISDLADCHILYANGLWVGPMCHLSGHAEVGRHVRINYGAKIGHHTVIGDYSFVSINAVTLSGVQIGRKCFIGAGAVLLENVKVGDNCVIGANAVVTKDVPDNSKAMGVPARWSDWIKYPSS